MLTAIIDYGSGNLRSAAKAFERAAADHGLAMETLVTDAPERVAAADRIVLPGVGAFADCMAGLTGIDGMVEAMTDAVQNRGRPFLGICVGMQLLASVGREHGDHQGFGWVPGEVVAIPAGPDRRVPHMGWQDLVLDRTDHPVLDGVVAMCESTLRACLQETFVDCCWRESSSTLRCADRSSTALIQPAWAPLPSTSGAS